MGDHMTGQVSIGAYVDLRLRNYIDYLVEERGLLTRSDALRLVIDEHMTVFNNRINGNQALTPSEVNASDNLQKSLNNSNINEIKVLKNDKKKSR